MLRRFYLTFCMPLFLLGLFESKLANAQDLETQESEVVSEVANVVEGNPVETVATDEDVVNDTFSSPKPLFNPQEYKSILFTAWEQDAIALARRAAESGGDSRGATKFEIERSQQREDITNKIKPPPEKREIRLAGILYDTGDRWTIWLNEERVTPDAVPPEVIDLKVHKEYIEFKWIDDYTNRIYPIRLRPHQRFNIDTRIFLPG